MNNSNFNRLAGLRRNRTLRNVCLIASGFSLLFVAVVGLDAVVSGSPLKLGYLFVFGVVFIVSSSFAAYYHLRFMSRE
jgi:arginine exporter protein ArgO